MKKMEIVFAGLNLKNPIIISSSSLTNTPEKNLKLEKAGAAAVVLKSIFEEQILLQTQRETANVDSSIYGSEGGDYMFEYIKNHTLNEYLNLIRDSKKLCSIPVIASINCYNNDNWYTFAKEIANAGADAIELNIMMLPTSKEVSFSVYEKKYAEIVGGLCKEIKTPVIVKLANNVGNIVYLANSIAANGAKGIVLFNKLYPFDIDIEKMTYSKGEILGHNSDLSNGLRWAGVVSPAVKNLDCAISGGVHSGDDIVKSILCGASAVEICSVLYNKDPEVVLPEMLDKLSSWMDKNGFDSIGAFKGKMVASEDSMEFFERTQFLKYFHG